MSKSKYVYVVEMYKGVSETHTFHGVFFNKESAIEKCEEILEKHNLWIASMDIPFDIYKQHVGELFDSYDYMYKWKDYLGYTAETWKKTYFSYWDWDITVVVNKFIVGKTMRDSILEDIVYSKTQPCDIEKEGYKVTKKDFSQSKQKTKKKCVYAVQSFRSIHEEEYFHGVFSNKKAAIKKCDDVLEDHVFWMISMKIPMDIYTIHIGDLFDNDKNTHIWKDYLGYSAETWENAHFLYEDCQYRGMIKATIKKYVVRENICDAKIVFSKTQPSVTGKESPRHHYDWWYFLGNNHTLPVDSHNIFIP